MEHSGLGRYGDPINPFGVLEAIARIHCLLKPGGILFLGVPTNSDYLIWNAHRIYGSLRYQLILSMGWELVDVENNQVFDLKGDATYYQPIVVLRKV